LVICVGSAAGIVDKYVDFALRVLSDLVSIPTVNPPGENYDRAAKYLRNVIREHLAIDAELIEVPQDYLDKLYPYAPQHRGKPRFIVYARSSATPSLHFNAHYDVVPPGSGWSRDPFKPVIENNKLYGRGASDDKASIACMLAALKRVVDEGVEPRIELAFVPDEESGGIGTKYLVEELGVAPPRVLVGEPTSSRLVAVGHKGVLRGLVRVLGRQGHAAAPWNCVNAFENGCRIALCFKEAVEQRFRTVVSSYPYERDEARYSTMSLGGIVRVSTNKENVVPGLFEFSFDARIVPELDLVRAEEILRRALDTCVSSVGSVRVEIVIKSAIPASVTPLQDPLVEFVRRVGAEVLGEAPKVFVNCGRYDSVFYVAKGSRAVIYGPGARGAPHAVDEHVPVEEIESFVEIYYRIVKGLCSR